MHQQFKREFKSINWLYLIHSAGKDVLGMNVLKKMQKQNQDLRKLEHIY